jgi:hypothetical protein
MRAAKSRKGAMRNYPDGCALIDKLYKTADKKAEYDRNKERASERIRLTNSKLRLSFIGLQRQTAASCLILSENAPATQFALSLSRLENIIQ